MPSGFCLQVGTLFSNLSGRDRQHRRLADAEYGRVDGYVRARRYGDVWMLNDPVRPPAGIVMLVVVGRATP